jgi:hypothetical protein
MGFENQDLVIKYCEQHKIELVGSWYDFGENKYICRGYNHAVVPNGTLIILFDTKRKTVNCFFKIGDHVEL